MAHKKLPKHVVKRLKEKGAIVKLDIGSGWNQEPGFINIDCRQLPGVDIVHDVESLPWPLPDVCATLVMARHMVEHINPTNQGFIKFMDECWRVLKIGGQMMLVTPYAGSPGYWADPTHINGCTPKTWDYFDPEAADAIFYRIYRPKPWKILNCFFQVDGNMEVLLEKRRPEKSYETV